MSKLSRLLRDWGLKAPRSLSPLPPPLPAPEFLRFPVYAGSGEEGFFIDFLGNRTRLSFLPAVNARLSGKVFGYPVPGAEYIHESEEWLAMLQAVLGAGRRFVGIELGAGWAPWLVSMKTAAFKTGIKDCVLIGVEGSEEHRAFISKHIVDNGFSEEEFTIVDGVVGMENGFVKFPKIARPNQDYGARILNNDSEENAVTVRSVSLSTLIQPLERVDFIHCDIQGAEADVFAAAIDSVTERVHRIVIGTHGRGIEDRLFDLFEGRGWCLEHEKATRYVIVKGRHRLKADGIQVWRNPRP